MTDRPVPAQIPLITYTTLWFLVAGTRCNLRCSHCFISCGPNDSRLGMMTSEEVRRYQGRDEGAGRAGVLSYRRRAVS